MKNIKITLAAVVVCFGLSGKSVYAQGIESWLKGEGEKAAPVEEATDVKDIAADTAPLVAEAKKLEVSKAKQSPSVESKIVNNSHGLDQIIYKISRAQANLEEMSDDLGGRKDKVISHLKEAILELKNAR